MVLRVAKETKCIAAQKLLLACLRALQRLPGSQRTGGTLHAQTLAGTQAADAPIGTILINGRMQSGSRDALGQTVKLLGGNLRTATVHLNAASLTGTQANHMVKLRACFLQSLSKRGRLLVIRT